MLKKIAPEIMCDLWDATVATGKLCALTPVVQPHGQGLGIAYANEPGYSPVPLQWCNGDNRDELQAYADQLNKELFGLDPRAALEVVCSSMFAQNKRGKVGVSC